MIKEYQKSKVNFENLKKKNLNELLDSCNTKYTTPEWGQKDEEVIEKQI